MHNVPRVKTSEEKKKERLIKSREEAKKYLEVYYPLLEMKSNNVYTPESLSMTKDLLTQVPDSYTFWNYRRRIIMHLQDSQEQEEIVEFCKTELTWVQSILKVYHKSYWCWFHRKWISERLGGNMDWKNELALCNYALDKDIRNFHCWNYRRYVCFQGNVKLDNELNYTLSKIEQDFSNYSAWHQRSYLIPKLYENDKETFLEIINDDFELVKNAFYTQPDDQSAWFYHQWLIAMSEKLDPDNFGERLKSEIEMCEELVSLEPDSKWPNLTLLHLLKRQSEERDEKYKDILNKLMEIDPLRKNYYQDFFGGGKRE